MIKVLGAYSGFVIVRWMFYSLVFVSSLLFKPVRPMIEHDVNQDISTIVADCYTEMRRVGGIVDSLLVWVLGNGKGVWVGEPTWSFTGRCSL